MKFPSKSSLLAALLVVLVLAGKLTVTILNDLWPVILAALIGALTSTLLYALGIPHAFLPEAAALTAIVTIIHKENK